MPTPRFERRATDREDRNLPVELAGLCAQSTSQLSGYIESFVVCFGRRVVMGRAESWGVEGKPGARGNGHTSAAKRPGSGSLLETIERKVAASSARALQVWLRSSIPNTDIADIDIREPALQVGKDCS